MDPLQTRRRLRGVEKRIKELEEKTGLIPTEEEEYGELQREEHRLLLGLVFYVEEWKLFEKHLLAETKELMARQNSAIIQLQKASWQ